MKKLIIILLIAMISISIALAGIKKGDIQKDFQYTQNITATHRVVSGFARESISPNFFRNDWDRYRYSLNSNWTNINESQANQERQRIFNSLLTQQEINYLSNLTNLQPNVWYYVDLTDRIVVEGQNENTMPFSNYNEVISEGDVTFNIDHTYQFVLQVYDYSPIVLDLNNDKKIDVAYNYWLPHAPKFFTQNVVRFDITGDMVPDLVEWLIGPNDGLLVEPGVKKVKSALDLFGTAGGYSDGYEKLATYDKDKNGFVEGKELEGFKVWIDKNQNGICEDNELFNISQFNVKKLSVNHNGKFVSYYETNDGQKRIMWDWWPAAIQVKKVAKE